MDRIDTGHHDPPRSATLTELLRSRLHTQSPEPDAAPDELDASLLDIISSARGVYTTIEVPAEVFVAYLGDRIPAHTPHPRALRQMHTADLYLACACARGDVHAVAVFEDRCIRRLDRVLSRLRLDSDTIAEIKQEIRHRLLVGEREQALIASFSGRGDLRGWVQVMAVRQALRRLGRAHREVPLDDDEMLQRIARPDTPALDYAKGIYRREFRQAFEDALRDLPDRDRLLLRQHYLDGSTIDELGRQYRVHRSTAARLLERARLVVLETTRTRMMSRLEVQPHELDSIMRMIQSQLDVSLRALRRCRKR